jgi:sortase A
MRRSSGKAAMIEQILLAVGAILLGFYAGARIHSFIMTRLALHSFEESRRVEPAVPAEAPAEVSTPKEPSYLLWSSARIKSYERSLFRTVEPPLAVLKIPKLNLEVPVLDGTDEVTLNRGVGRIKGTARPGEQGNVGIAGHRDGFFRGLKDIQGGDEIQLMTRDGTETYVVDRIQITKRSDVSVLRTDGRQSLTLVTCYPFYFVGSAPNRYVVQASRKQVQGAGPS